MPTDITPAGQNTLDSFVQHSRPPPVPVAISQEIRDRGSTFTATIYRASTVAEVQRCVKYLAKVVHGPRLASHEISAWRCMVLKPGKSGLGGPDDFEIITGSNDDGEKWAGSKILRVMENQSIIDAVVVVSRWYGGTMLGPARFTHIETCASEVCRVFKKNEEIADCLSTLTTLDDILADLRAELTEKRALTEPDYASWIESDLPRARRLIKARENAIKSVKLALRKLNEEPPKQSEEDKPRA
ncbi:ribosomal protein S5 domain 2-like protein [Fistulina hepatica ATCC 64428]|uniref:Ribosomal protein S5 domain 2-like protein n=1 Tax=Fistulina hepatica ATCC 64428 TaxID=1128425 RepID=A0A0D7AIX0_9AGAR|nr:ribosomal protein S5 domain 2-like protein [Fistulina hepatica ATCC 64428]